MSRIRVLTGITTTGTPHLGNYVGAIRPAIAASADPNVDAFFFLADYHALIKCDEPARIQSSRRQIAATWLAAGLDPERVHFYRQSDIPEIPELTWLLTCVTAKGMMNRAHAYKAASDANEAAGEDADAGVTMGLFSYPVLMAADILMFNAHKVPVGRDQVQHIEMARDIGARFNHLFGQGRSFFTLPEAVIEESVATLPGLDGRKMSKSYDNTIPLFEGGTKKLKEAVSRIVTDSRLPGEPKDPESNALALIFDAFGTADEARGFRADLGAGLGWGEAKQRLVERLELAIAPMRARYEAYMSDPQRLEEILQAGAARARALAAPLLSELREAVGLRRFVGAADFRGAQAERAALPQIKQYREADGRFYFKLLAADGTLLLQSEAYGSPRDAGQALQALRGLSAAELADALGAAAQVAPVARIAEALAMLTAAESERKARAAAGGSPG
jgi:tryptophanyl-tRNA synthetase